MERSELTSEEVVDVLKTVNSSGSVTEQLDTLFSHFAMKPEMVVVICFISVRVRSKFF